MEPIFLKRTYLTLKHFVMMPSPNLFENTLPTYLQVQRAFREFRMLNTLALSPFENCLIYKAENFVARKFYKLLWEREIRRITRWVQVSIPTTSFSSVYTTVTSNGLLHVFWKQDVPFSVYWQKIHLGPVWLSGDYLPNAGYLASNTRTTKKVPKTKL